MQELSEYKKDYYAFTGKLSDINRQIAFAGIAIIWIFKTSTKTGFKLDDNLIAPAIFIVLGLAFDMFQYIYQSLTWTIFYTFYKRKGVTEDFEVDSPEYLNWISWVFFFF